MEPQPLPERDRVEHGSTLLAELQSALGPSAVTADEPPAVGANAALDLASPGLVDTVQLSKGAAAYVDSAEASAVLFFEDPSARTFRRKLERYADPEQVTARGQPRSNALVAPIERIRRPTLVDLAEAWDVEAALATGEARVWIELWTPGGRLGKPDLGEKIAAAMADFADREAPDEQLQRFEAAEHDIWLVHLTPAAIRQLPRALPPVTSIHPPSQARLERRAREAVGTAIAEERIDPPASRAACIAILDSGVAEDHPLLREALVAPGVSVVPGVTSAQDAYPGGHGTGVAGVAAYRALAQDLVGGGRVRPASRLRERPPLERGRRCDFVGQPYGRGCRGRGGDRGDHGAPPVPVERGAADLAPDVVVVRGGPACVQRRCRPPHLHRRWQRHTRAGSRRLPGNEPGLGAP